MFIYPCVIRKHISISPLFGDDYSYAYRIESYRAYRVERSDGCKTRFSQEETINTDMATRGNLNILCIFVQF